MSSQKKKTSVRTSIVIVAVVVLMFTACASIPNVELSEYRAAFDKAAIATNEVLIDFDTTVGEAKKFNTNAKGASAQDKVLSPFPSALNDGSDGPQATEVRRTAWRVIERYNSVLADLAEGKSDEEMKNAVGGLGESIEKFIQTAGNSAIPGLSVAIDIARTVAKKFEQLRRAKEFERAIREGRPLIEKILDALHEDANDQYTLRQGIVRHTFNEQMSSLTTSIGDLSALIDSYKTPTTGATSPIADLDGKEFLLTVNKRLNIAARPLANQLQEFPFSLAWAQQDGEPFTLAAKSIVELLLVEIEQRAATMVALVREIGAVRDMLRAYQTLLTKTKYGMAKLNQALDAPVNIENEADEIIATVFEIKQNIEKYYVARKKASVVKPVTATAESTTPR